ncbi:HAD family hydrolase [Sabulicella rubraurantiaca]|uniref:HAD family hydrolase n=1 Tax=Sabulicella rubraurantiaca TaxID=2811429 RepID=UPI001A959E2C|nr:HAD family phosphatase [Sabulicella rubraurantiaca]
MIPRPLDAVIFDMDGLLLDTETLYRQAIVSSCASQGHEMPGHLHLSLIGTPQEAGDALLRGHFGLTFDLDAYHAACAQHFDRLCEASVPLRPGALELLGYLKANDIPMAVATSTTRSRAEPRLARAGILDFFHGLVTRSDVRRGKPHPDSFLAAAAALQARPGHCLALEDSHNGVRAAAAAGMATVMIPDLLAPTPEIERLCVTVWPSLLEVLHRLELVGATRG